MSYSPPALTLAPEDWLAIEREACRRSLATFIRRAWHVLEPGQPYIHGWHMDAIAMHLEAITEGRINRLLINIPPGTMKSLSSAVFWPAWEWGPRGSPHIRFIGASHEDGLATRDNMKMRRLIQSEWYQKLWPTNFVNDQNEKTYFENDKTGWRQSCAVKSMTGRRGDRVLWDDPHSVEGAHSVANLLTANRVFDETLPTRLNNPISSAIVVNMQRLNQDDVSGSILSRNLGYTHLCLPMEYEGNKTPNALGFIDPRTEIGELLFSARFPRDVVERDKLIMGEYAVAGQFQQRPSPISGGIFKADQLRFVDAIPAGVHIAWCRGWDLASSESSVAAYTAGVKLGRMSDGRWIIADVKRFRRGATERDTAIKNTAAEDGRGVEISIPNDPGAAGSTQVIYLTSQLAGYRVHSSAETGDKIQRAQPMASQVNVGNVLILIGPWNREFLDEVKLFPNLNFKDQVDALSRAFARLIEARMPMQISDEFAAAARRPA